MVTLGILYANRADWSGLMTHSTHQSFWKSKIPRDSKYLKWLRGHPCVICNSIYTEAHHTSTGGIGIKGSDYEAVPVCHTCHMMLHNQYAKNSYWDENILKSIIEGLLTKYRVLHEKRYKK